MRSYTIACWRGGWIVYAGQERRWPVAHGFASREEAETWVKAAQLSKVPRREEDGADA
jgi:hypothetical protein